MKNIQTKSENAFRLFAMGMVIVAISACVRPIWSIRGGSWGMIIGGVAMVMGMMSRTYWMKSADVRTRRLDRMSLLAGLCYIVSGGFALESNNVWMLIFTVGTIFLCYSVFVRKEDKKA